MVKENGLLLDVSVFNQKTGGRLRGLEECRLLHATPEPERHNGLTRWLTAGKPRNCSSTSTTGQVPSTLLWCHLSLWVSMTHQRNKPSQPTKAPTLICQKVLCSEANAASPSPHLRPSIMDVCFHFKKTNELFRWRKDLMNCLLRSFRGRSRAAAHSDDHKRMFIILV